MRLILVFALISVTTALQPANGHINTLQDVEDDLFFSENQLGSDTKERTPNKRFVTSFLPQGITSGFGLSNLFKKFTNVGTILGYNGTKLNRLKKLYNSGYAKQHLLFKRRILNLIIRTCSFITRFLPDEPVEANPQLFALKKKPGYSSVESYPERVSTLVDFVTQGSGSVEVSPPKVAEIVTRTPTVITTERLVVVSENIENVQNGLLETNAAQLDKPESLNIPTLEGEESLEALIKEAQQAEESLEIIEEEERSLEDFPQKPEERTSMGASDNKTEAFLQETSDSSLDLDKEEPGNTSENLVEKAKRQSNKLEDSNEINELETVATNLDDFVQKPKEKIISQELIQEIVGKSLDLNETKFKNISENLVEKIKWEVENTTNKFEENIQDILEETSTKPTIHTDIFIYTDVTTGEPFVNSSIVHIDLAQDNKQKSNDSTNTTNEPTEKVKRSLIKEHSPTERVKRSLIKGHSSSSKVINRTKTSSNFTETSQLSSTDAELTTISTTYKPNEESNFHLSTHNSSTVNRNSSLEHIMKIPYKLRNIRSSEDSELDQHLKSTSPLEPIIDQNLKSSTTTMEPIKEMNEDSSKNYDPGHTSKEVTFSLNHRRFLGRVVTSTKKTVEKRVSYGNTTVIQIFPEGYDEEDLERILSLMRQEDKNGMLIIFGVYNGTASVSSNIESEREKSNSSNLPRDIDTKITPAFSPSNGEVDTMLISSNNSESGLLLINTSNLKVTKNQNIESNLKETKNQDILGDDLSESSKLKQAGISEEIKQESSTSTTMDKNNKFVRETDTFVLNLSDKDRSEIEKAAKIGDNIFILERVARNINAQQQHFAQLKNFKNLTQLMKNVISNINNGGNFSVIDLNGKSKKFVQVVVHKSLIVEDLEEETRGLNVIPEKRKKRDLGTGIFTGAINRFRQISPSFQGFSGTQRFNIPIPRHRATSFYGPSNFPNRHYVRKTPCVRQYHGAKVVKHYNVGHHNSGHHKYGHYCAGYNNAGQSKNLYNNHQSVKNQASGKNFNYQQKSVTTHGTNEFKSDNFNSPNFGTIKNSKPTSKVEIGEFNFLPHFEKKHQFTSAQNSDNVKNQQFTSDEKSGGVLFSFKSLPLFDAPKTFKSFNVFNSLNHAQNVDDTHINQHQKFQQLDANQRKVFFGSNHNVANQLVDTSTQPKIVRVENNGFKVLPHFELTQNFLDHQKELGVSKTGFTILKTSEDENNNNRIHLLPFLESINHFTKDAQSTQKNNANNVVAANIVNDVEKDEFNFLPHFKRPKNFSTFGHFESSFPSQEKQDAIKQQFEAQKQQNFDKIVQFDGFKSVPHFEQKNSFLTHRVINTIKNHGQHLQKIPVSGGGIVNIVQNQKGSDGPKNLNFAQRVINILEARQKELDGRTVSERIQNTPNLGHGFAVTPEQDKFKISHPEYKLVTFDLENEEATSVPKFSIPPPGEANLGNSKVILSQQLQKVSASQRVSPQLQVTSQTVTANQGIIPEFQPTLQKGSGSPEINPQFQSTVQKATPSVNYEVNVPRFNSMVSQRGNFHDFNPFSLQVTEDSEKFGKPSVQILKPAVKNVEIFSENGKESFKPFPLQVSTEQTQNFGNPKEQIMKSAAKNIDYFSEKDVLSAKNQEDVKEPTIENLEVSTQQLNLIKPNTLNPTDNFSEKDIPSTYNLNTEDIQNGSIRPVIGATRKFTEKSLSSTTPFNIPRESHFSKHIFVTENPRRQHFISVGNPIVITDGSLLLTNLRQDGFPEIKDLRVFPQQFDFKIADKKNEQLEFVPESSFPENFKTNAYQISKPDDLQKNQNLSDFRFPESSIHQFPRKQGNPNLNGVRVPSSYRLPPFATRFGSFQDAKEIKATPKDEVAESTNISKEVVTTRGTFQDAKRTQETMESTNISKEFSQHALKVFEEPSNLASKSRDTASTENMYNRLRPKFIWKSVDQIEAGSTIDKTTSHFRQPIRNPTEVVEGTTIANDLQDHSTVLQILKASSKPVHFAKDISNPIQVLKPILRVRNSTYFGRTSNQRGNPSQLWTPGVKRVQIAEEHVRPTQNSLGSEVQQKYQEQASSIENYQTNGPILDDWYNHKTTNLPILDNTGPKLTHRGDVFDYVDSEDHLTANSQKNLDKSPKFVLTPSKSSILGRQNSRTYNRQKLGSAVLAFGLSSPRKPTEYATNQLQLSDLKVNQFGDFTTNFEGNQPSQGSEDSEENHTTKFEGSYGTLGENSQHSTETSNLEKTFSENYDRSRLQPIPSRNKFQNPENIRNVPTTLISESFKRRNDAKKIQSEHFRRKNEEIEDVESRVKSEYDSVISGGGDLNYVKSSAGPNKLLEDEDFDQVALELAQSTFGRRLIPKSDVNNY